VGIARTALLTVCLPPMLAAAWTAFVSRERPSVRTTGGLLLALLGLMLVGGGPGMNDGGSGAAPLLGLATGVLAAVAFASFSGLVRILVRVIHPLQVVTFGFVVGAILLAPVVVVSSPAGSIASFDVATTLQLVLVVLYLGAGPTALAYICYFYGMRLSRSMVSGITVTMVEPAVAVLLAAGLLGETLSPVAWLGTALLLLATVAAPTLSARAPSAERGSRVPARLARPGAGGGKDLIGQLCVVDRAGKHAGAHHA
jgi:drug/metabolite transporter, DME family